MKWKVGFREKVHEKRVHAARKCRKWKDKFDTLPGPKRGPGRSRRVLKALQKQKKWCWTGREGGDPTRPIYIG